MCVWFGIYWGNFVKRNCRFSNQKFKNEYEEREMKKNLYWLPILVYTYLTYYTQVAIAIKYWLWFEFHFQKEASAFSFTPNPLWVILLWHFWWYDFILFIFFNWNAIFECLLCQRLWFSKTVFIGIFFLMWIVQKCCYISEIVHSDCQLHAKHLV